MSAPGPDEIRAKVSARAFGNPVIQNDFRGFVAETIVESALEPTWRCCSGDWVGWDFEHLDKTRLEVEQSAARQTWTAPKRPSPATFDIRTRSGFYIGNEWHPGLAGTPTSTCSPITLSRTPPLITWTPTSGSFTSWPPNACQRTKRLDWQGSHHWLPLPDGRRC